MPISPSLPLPLLQINDPLLAAGGCCAVFVQHGGIAVPDDAAFGDNDRRVGMDGPLQQRGQALQRIQLIADFLHGKALRLIQQIADPRHAAQRSAKRKAGNSFNDRSL